MKKLGDFEKDKIRKANEEAERQEEAAELPTIPEEGKPKIVQKRGFRIVLVMMGVSAIS